MLGRVLRPLDEGYDKARSVHNAMIDRRPAIIAQCAAVADVLCALRAATEYRMTISLRGGGHSFPGFSVCEGGLMIDLSEMAAVHVDPATRTARAQGGTNWGQFDFETEAFGLATTGGLVRTTGIAGLTLAGGHGFLMRKFGLACDNLLSADVVTATGTLVKASASDNPDLFWALRGGGGNFGIVTSFEYRLHPVGPVFGGLLIFPSAEGHRVLKFYDEFTAGAPDELGILAVLGTLPTGEKVIAHPVCYCGALEQGEQVLHPFRTFTTPVVDQLQKMPYTAVQSIVENFNPPGLRNYVKSVYLDELRPEAIEIMMEMHSRSPAPLTHMVLYTLGGKVSRIPGDETAVTHRDARHIALAVSIWQDAKDDDINIAWTREFADRMQPYSAGGFYPNYDQEALPDRVAATFGPEKYARLTAIKRKYDPENIFHLNQNINPAKD